VVLIGLRRSRLRQIREYFAQHQVRKLQVGAGDNPLAGWLNSEGFAPSSFTHSLKAARGYLLLDAREPFPFEEASVDYVFHEHVIEHLSYQQGQFMVAECMRILKPGGRMRVSTPDLAVFVGLFGDDIDKNQQQFLREYVDFNSRVWSTDLKHVTDNEAVFVLNHNFRAWGHQFIYDYQTLAGLLSEAGFVDIERQSPQMSSDSHLRGLEARKEFVSIFGSLIVEASKPR
jgi:predicted SAM-dependent methyltransferase